MTRKYKRLSALFLGLSAVCLFGPVLFFFIRAFVCGDAQQKVTLGMTFTAAIVLFFINVIMKSHLRSVLFILLLGICSVLDKYLYIIVVFSITTFAEELVFFPLFRFYRNKARINREIDKRIGA